MIEGLEDELINEEQQPVRNGTELPGAGLYWIGAILILVGTVAMLIGLMKSGAPEYSETLNIGLLNDKTNLVMAGGLTSVSGTICVCTRYAVGRVRDLLGARGNQT